jgi:hypothetical protein
MYPPYLHLNTLLVLCLTEYSLLLLVQVSVRRYTVQEMDKAWTLKRMTEWKPVVVRIGRSE